MSLQTCNITGCIVTPEGLPAPNVTIKFTMTRRDRDGDCVIIPYPVTTVADVDGMIDVDLWPNDLGYAGTYYVVEISSSNAKSKTIFPLTSAVVPNQPSAIFADILELTPPPAVDEAILILSKAREARDEAILAADSASSDAANTALDAISTNEDRIQTGLDAVQTAADRAATALDRIATGEDRVQTALDRIATGEDRIQTGLDREATASDVVLTSSDAAQTALDRIATGADALATAGDRVATGQDRSEVEAALEIIRTEYVVYVIQPAGTPIPVGQYLATASGITTGVFDRMVLKAPTGSGSVSVQLVINGVPLPDIHTVTNASPVVLNGLSIAITQGDTVSFAVLSATASQLWAQITGLLK